MAKRRMNRDRVSTVDDYDDDDVADQDDESCATETISFSDVTHSLALLHDRIEGIGATLELLESRVQVIEDAEPEPVVMDKFRELKTSVVLQDCVRIAFETMLRHRTVAQIRDVEQTRRIMTEVAKAAETLYDCLVEQFGIKQS